MKKQEFVNDIKLPSLNDLIFLSKKHWSCYAQLKSDLQNYICYKIKQYKITPVKKIKILKINWIEPNKKRDKDNIIAGGKKFIIDALVQAHIIKNDSWNFISQFQDTFTIADTFKQIVSIYYEK